MEPVIKDIPEFQVIGMIDTFNPETKHLIPELWAKFAPRMGDIKNVSHWVTYGLCLPSTASDGHFDYMAALGVADLSEVPEGMRGLTVPAHRYAVFTHKTGDGTLHSDLQKTVHHIWNVWLPHSEFKRAQAPDFELYDERFDAVHQTGEFDICLPIE